MLYYSYIEVVMRIRKYIETDTDSLIDLFYNTILNVNIRDYAAEQVKVWANRKDNLAKNKDFFRDLYTLVAIDNDIIVGYGNISDSGYLDHLFVHKDYQGRGIATMLVDELEKYAIAQNIENIEVHSSITARVFFEKRGYRAIKEQQVTLENVQLTNYLMRKKLL